MKERIYTIPLTDALNEKCSCILCALENKLEKDMVSYFLGPSLMEPSNREDTNKNGFCRSHLKMLLNGTNSLGLALMLETHIDEIKRGLSQKKRGIFSRTDFVSLSEKLYNTFSSCSLCNRLSENMKAAAENLVYLIDTEPSFEKRFYSSSLLCLNHSALVFSVCRKELGGRRAEKFAEKLLKALDEKTGRTKDNLHSFTTSFDYRSQSEKTRQEAVLSVPDAVDFLAGDK